MNEITLTLKWKEGRKDRETVTELPMDKNWEEIQEHIRLFVKTAVQYNTNSPIPEGLLKEGEVV